MVVVEIIIKSMLEDRLENETQGNRNDQIMVNNNL